MRERRRERRVRDFMVTRDWRRKIKKLGLGKESIHGKGGNILLPHLPFP